MPELPEVETIRLQLAKLIPGLVIRDIEISKEKSFHGDKKLIKGAEITDVRRFAKMLSLDTDKGLSLVVHLKMTGQLIFEKSKIPAFAKASAGKQNLNYKKEEKDKLPDKYTRVIIHFANGSRLYFNDLRRFGWMRIVKEQKIPPQRDPASGGTTNKEQRDTIPSLQGLIKNLGPDPFKIATRQVYKILQSSIRPIKLVLMDQEKLAGVGNIYANEALFLARINPARKANKLSSHEAIKLLNNLKKILREGMRWGGASENHYLNAYGEKGEMQEHFLVYGRDGEECVNKCGNKVKRIRQGGRSSFFCPKCQKLD